MFSLHGYVRWCQLSIQRESDSCSNGGRGAKGAEQLSRLRTDDVFFFVGAIRRDRSTRGDAPFVSRTVWKDAINRGPIYVPACRREHIYRPGQPLFPPVCLTCDCVLRLQRAENVTKLPRPLPTTNVAARATTRVAHRPVPVWGEIGWARCGATLGVSVRCVAG